jgi:phospholipid/cholesterol/gamma-HCH transport system permease protein
VRIDDDETTLKTKSNMAKPPIWELRPDGKHAALSVSGEWIALSGRIPDFSSDGLNKMVACETLAFTMTDVGRWDSGLIEFLWGAKQAAESNHIAIDDTALPEAARKLLGLLGSGPPDTQAAKHQRRFILTFIGDRVLAILSDLGTLSVLLSATVKAGALAPFGQARVRKVDVLANLRDAGPAALLIVSVVNFLVGAILAFVGAAQLNKFAAGTYVANLVGLALVREMAPVMTAIVMAGRTGGAYAARIATMQGGEEIDALKVIGIPVVDYIILPAILSLVIMMPFLYLYGCLVGITGGLVVATTMLGITVSSYLHQTLTAVPLSQFEFGFVKSIAFAFLIGVTSCHIGLKSGRSSADVGISATQAVVVGIVGVIAMDAVFAVLANSIGI